MAPKMKTGKQIGRGSGNLLVPDPSGMGTYR